MLINSKDLKNFSKKFILSHRLNNNSKQKMIKNILKSKKETDLFKSTKIC